MIFRSKTGIDSLDQLLARRDYERALAVIDAELETHPDSTSLLLRKAEVLVLSEQRKGAVEIYERLAEDYTRQGFYARAIAVTNKIVRLVPGRTDVSARLARRIARQQESERSERERLSRASTQPERASAPPDEAEPSGDATEPAPGEGDQEARERSASRFFAEFPEAALEKLLAVTSVRAFDPGAVIVREGDPGTSLFLIADGHVEVHTRDPRGEGIVLAELGPGEFFGEVAVLTGRPRTATITARDTVSVIEIQRDLLGRIAADHPEVGDVLQRFYQRRAHATVEAILTRLRGGGD